jgi:hypothetical protein
MAFFCIYQFVWTVHGHSVIFLYILEGIEESGCYRCWTMPVLLRTLEGIADAAWDLALKASCALHDAGILLRTLEGIADAALDLALKASCALHAVSILLRTLVGIADAAWDLALKASCALHAASILLRTLVGIADAAWDLASKHHGQCMLLQYTSSYLGGHCRCRMESGIKSIMCIACCQYTSSYLGGH